MDSGGLGSANCPICDKEFSRSQIEAHVDKCIFLNGTAPEQGVKRQSDSSPRPQAKKTKNARHDEPLEAGPSKAAPKFEVKKPLADHLRPTSLSQYVGQHHILGPNCVFRSLIEQNNIPSMILWGPPGCGKTTLAHIIHKMCQERKGDIRFSKLSATMAGVNDVKEIVQVAKNELATFKRRTILFMDEIHRFNKLQQDIFLPHVESGTVTLIGATTENPSFSLNNALLSRCRVFVLEKLKKADIIEILKRAAAESEADIVIGGQKGMDKNGKYIVEMESIEWLADMSDGDARIALNSFQMALDSKQGNSSSILITLSDIKDGIKRSHLLYDRKGEEHYNMISALHKSIRASDDNATLYWLTRMLEGGEDPMFVARRLVRAASEDVGVADPMALTLAVSAMQGCQMIGMPECDVLLAQVAIYLSRTHKSREVDHALANAKKCIHSHQGPLPSVPLHLRNAPTRLMRDLGYGKGYNMRHRDESNLTYMPEGLESVSFFSRQ
ncbi:hypothetical protein AAG570_001874 [Ranatra chinensis]|uniref:AAA+ ATPase domain-containing protein n=1 Tax=Ranatra chinensis TaxID=642074 RepID=A0ABD0YAL4_9HEMI